MQPEYRFPDMTTAHQWREGYRVLRLLDPEVAPMMARVAASVVVARPDIHPVAALRALRMATGRHSGRYRDFTPSAWHRLTLAGIVIVADDEPPQPPPMIRSRRPSAA